MFSHLYCDEWHKISFCSILKDFHSRIKQKSFVCVWIKYEHLKKQTLNCSRRMLANHSLDVFCFTFPTPGYSFLFFVILLSITSFWISDERYVVVVEHTILFNPSEWQKKKEKTLVPNWFYFIALLSLELLTHNNIVDFVE